jgi:alkanesulfonate monooxygenase SsuD/methylene tetrahydromethanopterin reductase-like flavin-dependent oxidoreductase (luciferase family)
MSSRSCHLPPDLSSWLIPFWGAIAAQDRSRPPARLEPDVPESRPGLVRHPYQGTHYQLVRPLNSPNSVQRPHPPVLIGGSGERQTLRLVARYADACNLFDLPGTRFADNLAAKLAVLREHCAAEGRDYASIEKTVTTQFSLGDDPDKGLAGLLEHIRELAAVDIEHVLLSPHGPWGEATLTAITSLVPQVHAIPVAGTAVC